MLFLCFPVFIFVSNAVSFIPLRQENFYNFGVVLQKHFQKDDFIIVSNDCLELSLEYYFDQKVLNIEEPQSLSIEPQSKRALFDQINQTCKNQLKVYLIIDHRDRLAFQPVFDLLKSKFKIETIGWAEEILWAFDVYLVSV